MFQVQLWKLLSLVSEQVFIHQFKYALQISRSFHFLCTYIYNCTDFPQPPAITEIATGSHSVTVTWNVPFSHIPLLNYIVILLSSNDSEVITTVTVTDTMATLNEPYLIPFTSYVVCVQAVNRAGASKPYKQHFTTDEAGIIGTV